MQLSYCKCTRIFVCQLTLYSRHILRDVTSCDVTERKVERVYESEYIVWKKRNAKAETRSKAEEASGSGARGAFMEGLRFRRLAHEREGNCLTAEWELRESMIGTDLPKESLPFVFRVFFSLRGQSGRKYHCSITLKIIVTFVVSSFVHGTCTVYRLLSSLSQSTEYINKNTIYIFSFNLTLTNHKI